MLDDPIFIRMLARLCYGGLRALGFAALARLLRDAGVILCYHNVVSAAEDAEIEHAGVHMPLPRFESQMQWLASHYDVVSLREVTDRLISGRSLQRLAAVTFDDGYAGVFEHALPVLRALGIPATVFVITSAPAGSAVFWWDHPELQHADSSERRRRWLEALRGDGPAILQDLALDPGKLAPSPSRRCADWNVLALAARSGITLGVHSATHRTLPQLSDAELVGELVTSRDVLAENTGTTPEFFAHPYGLWDKRVRRAVQAAGYRGACTLDYGLVVAGADLWALPRVNIPSGIDAAAFEAWTAGVSLGKMLRL